MGALRVLQLGEGWNLGTDKERREKREGACV